MVRYYSGDNKIKILFQNLKILVVVGSFRLNDVSIIRWCTDRIGSTDSSFWSSSERLSKSGAVGLAFGSARCSFDAGIQICWKR